VAVDAGGIVLKAVLEILLILLLFASIMFRDWMVHGKGGSKVDAWWVRRREARRSHHRT
jgi:hypothetical protein